MDKQINDIKNISNLENKQSAEEKTEDLSECLNNIADPNRQQPVESGSSSTTSNSNLSDL